MSKNTMAVLIACFMLTLCVPYCLTDNGSDADSTIDIADIHVHSFTDSISMNAGSSESFEIELFNASPTDTYQVLVTSALYKNSHMSTSVSLSSVSVDPGKTVTATVNVSSNKVAVDDRMLYIRISVMNITASSAEVTDMFGIPVSVSSSYSSGDAYNKILGVIESPVDSAPINAAITFAVWIGIAFAADRITATVLRSRASKDDNQDGQNEAAKAGRFLFVLIILIGMPQSLKVGGVSEEITSVVSDVVSVVNALVIAFIIWNIYKVVMYNLIVTRDKKDKIDDSLFPLTKMVGKLIILIITVSYILSVFGMDLATIVTSAGIVTLAVSLGAQSTLNQFFCGIVLLTTRPFRIGDKVRLGNSTEVLIVRKIGVMETEFKVWLNEEVQHIPNSTVMASNIINITKEDKSYKVVDYIDVDYYADLDLVRKIIMDILTVHPKIINDGSKSLPDFRFYSIEESSIRIRISYIVNDHEVWHLVSCQIKEMIYRKFVASGIKVPHNIIDVHVE